MLKFAAVGSHSRGCCMQIAMCAVLTSTWAAPLAQQTSFETQDLLPELAARIATVLSPAVQVTLTPPSSDAGDDLQPVVAALAGLLSARGVRVVAAGDGIASVRLSCLENLRERSCLAQIQRGSASDVVMVTRPREIEPGAERRASPVLEVRPLFAQPAPILDVARLGDRLLVLDPSSVTLYQQTERGWQSVQSRQVPRSRVWPRDLRGRLRTEAGRFEAFLPGVTCAGDVNPMSLECADGQRSWPLGIENVGLEPSRNYFNTPEGLSFYGAASLPADTGARWLIVNRSGALNFLDSSRRSIANAGTGDDVTALTTPCGPDTYVIVGARSDGRDSLRLFQVARRRLVATAAPVLLPGILTVLWAMPGANAATAVAYDTGAGRYEAFLVNISCGR